MAQKGAREQRARDRSQQYIKRNGQFIPVNDVGIFDRYHERIYKRNKHSSNHIQTINPASINTSLKSYNYAKTDSRRYKQATSVPSLSKINQIAHDKEIAKQLQHQQYKKDTHYLRDIVTVHCNRPSLIKHDFVKFKEQETYYYRGYLYRIELGDICDHDEYATGILLPQPIPVAELHHIIFPVQDIRTQIQQDMGANATQTMAKLHFIPSNDVFMTNELEEYKKIQKHNHDLLQFHPDRFKFCYVVPLLYNANCDSYDCIQTADLRSNLIFKLDKKVRILRMDMPQILWRIEHWLNIIELKQKLQTLSPDIDIDTTLLFQAMDRAPSSNKSYQILNSVGAYILKFLTTLHKFSIQCTASANDIRNYVENRTDKICNEHNNQSHQHPDILIKIAKRLGLIQFVKRKDFEGCHSLYYIEPELQVISKGHGAKRTYRYLAANLLQSIIGVAWYSCMNKQSIKRRDLFSYSMRSNLKFLKDLGIISETFRIEQPFEWIRNDSIIHQVRSVNALKNIAIIDTLKSTPTLNASLMAVCHKSTMYEHSGITLERLAILGDAILDMFVVWHICRGIGDREFTPKIVDHKVTHSSWGEYIAQQRHFWVEDGSLSRSVMASGLRGYVTWRMNKKRENDLKRLSRNLESKMKSQLNEFVTKGEHYHETKQQDNMSDITDMSDSSTLQNIYGEGVPPGRGMKDRTINKSLSTIFEALLASIFMGSNHEIYSKSSNLRHTSFDVIPCIQFLISFLGNHSAWKKTMAPYINTYFKITVSKRAFIAIGYNEHSDKPILEHLNQVDSKYYLDLDLCPNCKQEGRLVFKESHIKQSQRKVDWRKNGLMLAEIFYDKDHAHEINERLDMFRKQDDTDEYMNAYFCKQCRHFIGYHVMVCTQYSIRQTQGISFSMKKVTITPFEPKEMNCKQNTQNPKGRKTHIIKECGQCLAKLELLRYSHIEHVQDNDDICLENINIQYCKECQLYYSYHYIKYPVKKST
eukprot:623905_1